MDILLIIIPLCMAGGFCAGFVAGLFFGGVLYRNRISRELRRNNGTIK